jgi:hypothetical protein
MTKNIFWFFHTMSVFKHQIESRNATQSAAIFLYHRVPWSYSWKLSLLDRVKVHSTHKLHIQEFLRHGPCTGYTQEDSNSPSSSLSTCVAHIRRADKMPRTPQDPCSKYRPQTLSKHKETDNPSDPTSNATNLQHTQCTQEDDSNNLSSCFSSFYIMLSHECNTKNKKQAHLASPNVDWALS